MDQKTEFEISQSHYNPSVVILGIKGFIDVNAAPQFEFQLNKLIEDGQVCVVIDMTKVVYISSAGIGVIVGMLKKFRDQGGGDVKIMHASPKILRVFESIGLTELVDFLTSETEIAHWVPRKMESSVHHFSFFFKDQHLVCGREHRLRVEAHDKNNEIVKDYTGEPQLSIDSGLVFPRILQGFNEGIWEGMLITTDSGMRKITLTEGEVKSQFFLRIYEEERKADFPCLLACRGCGNRANVKGMDIYRCAYCNEIFYVDAWGHVIPLKKGSPERQGQARFKSLEIKINSDINYLNAIRRFISSVCEQEKLDETIINEVVLATEEALLNIIEHSHNFDPRYVVIVKLRFHNKQLSVRIRDNGTPYDITNQKVISLKSCIMKGRKGGVGGMLINRLMDRVEYNSYKKFNQLLMIKRYPKPFA